MSFNKEVLEDKIEEKLKNIGYKLVKLSIYQGKKRNKINLVIYDSNGISHEDCKKVTKEIMNDSELDGDFGEDYILEVSSPGMNRKLSSLREFIVFMGKEIEFSLREESIPKFGKIERVKENTLYILDYNSKKTIQTGIDDIAYAKLK